MYCVYCGEKNPADYRFCHYCGNKRHEELAADPARHQRMGGSEVDEAIKQVRRLFLSAAVEYGKKGVDTPFELIDVSAHADKFDAIGRATKQQIEELVSPNKFPEADRRVYNDDSMVFLTYLGMLSILADAIPSTMLKQGAFSLKALVFYASRSDKVLGEQNWKAADEIAVLYLEEARETKAAFYLVDPLVKAAWARLKLGDRRTCREYLDEFDRIVGNALRETPEYPMVDDPDLLRQWVARSQMQAASLRKML